MVIEKTIVCLLLSISSINGIVEQVLQIFVCLVEKDHANSFLTALLQRWEKVTNEDEDEKIEPQNLKMNYT